MELLRRYGWPGNVRELRNIMERARLLCGDGPITGAHFPLEKMGSMLPMRNAAWSPRATAPPPVAPLAATPANAPPGAPADSRGERERILWALEQCAGNQTQAAKLLGVSRRTLVSRIEVYGLPRPRKNLS